MRVGYHAPLPPAATGVADYAQALLHALRAHCEPLPGARDADAHLYQLGNNPSHRGAMDRFHQHPDVALLHDANLHHYYLGSLSRGEYIGEFCHQYGPWYRTYAAQAWNERACSAADPRYFRYAMLASVVNKARHIVVHNPAAAHIVEQHGGAGKVSVIPHLVTAPPPVAEHEKIARRHRLGLTARSCLLGVFGHLRESKRLGVILRALRNARRREPGIFLLIAGRFVSANYARSLPLDQEGVIRLGFLEPGEFWRWAAAVDACINLRAPSCGETSGIAMRLMSLAKPLIVTAGLEYSAFPPGAVLPVDADVCEQAALEEWMVQLARHREWGVAIGQAAAEHVARRHAPDAVARRFVEVLTPQPQCASPSA